MLLSPSDTLTFPLSLYTSLFRTYTACQYISSLSFHGHTLGPLVLLDWFAFIGLDVFTVQLLPSAIQDSYSGSALKSRLTYTMLIPQNCKSSINRLSTIWNTFPVSLGYLYSIIVCTLKRDEKDSTEWLWLNMLQNQLQFVTSH